jgi:hypothetical protein
MSSLVDFVVFCCHSVHILSESKPLHDDSFFEKNILPFVFNNIPLTKMNESFIFFVYNQ